MRSYLRIRADRVEEVTGEVVREQPLTVYVNGDRFLTLLCSPMQLEALVIGYLWMEKVIQALVEEPAGLLGLRGLEELDDPAAGGQVHDRTVHERVVKFTQLEQDPVDTGNVR